MLSWLFKKKRGGIGAPKAAHAATPTVQAQATAHAKLADKAKLADEARTLWLGRLQSARGDDVALLDIAQAAPVLEIKLAAVEGLVAEEALKQAERAFRSHDRRVHQAAKQRFMATVARREARARAKALIDTATALAGEALLPANRMVALDRDWQALDASLLDPAQCADFATLRDRLDAAVRQHGEQQREARRWTADASRALTELRLACIDALVDGSGSDIALRCGSARAVLEARPDEPATATLGEDLQVALQMAAGAETRLAWLAALKHATPALVPAPEPPMRSENAPHGDPAESSGPASAVADRAVSEPVPPALTAAQRWRALPPVADPELAHALNERFERWQRGQLPARTPAPPERTARFAAKALSAEQQHRLDALLQQAETALAEGQLSAMQQHLQSVDAALDEMHGAVLSDTLQARCQALHTERVRLKGWQQWGGGRARDGLLAEAEELARLTLAAADPSAPEAPKLHLKAHGDAIHTLRSRWKELDRLGAPASQTLWQRFDAALQAAHQPVAAHQAVLKAARHDNLLAREALLSTLDAVALRATFEIADDRAWDWKEPLRALDRFHLAWRQLGPVEHTVPPGARSAVQQRWRHSVDRIERPLQEARRAAEAEREQIIVRAEALLQGLGQNVPLRDAAQQVRELQAQWQHHARTLPLTRAVEGALWTRFKAATDAVFAQRNAAFDARDAELAANLAAREALLERLSALAADAPAAEAQRTLADVDRAWRQSAELPRSAVGAVEARYRDARAATLQMLTDRELAQWQAQCDTLASKLALCAERERGFADHADLARRWAAHGALPAAWEQALAQRWSYGAEPGPLAERAVDELLLQLEATFDMPATAEQMAARRDMKLRALKDALEGRSSADPGPAQHSEWLAAALRQSGANVAQRERLLAIVAALRRSPPASLGSPALRA